jgi:hypothetical protein
MGVDNPNEDMEETWRLYPTWLLRHGNSWFKLWHTGLRTHGKRSELNQK